jgi:hypothetical protein
MEADSPAGIRLLLSQKYAARREQHRSPIHTLRAGYDVVFIDVCLRRKGNGNPRENGIN